jgi:hypothetical protein
MAPLLGRSPSLVDLHECYAKRGRINDAAPVTSASHRVLDADVEHVWTVVADVRRWPAWWPAMRGAQVDRVAVDAPFRWRAGSTPIRSRFAVVEPRRELSWTGRVLLFTAVDRHVLEPLADDRTRVTVEESLQGPLLPWAYPGDQLRANHEGWLDALAATVSSEG